MPTKYRINWDNGNDAGTFPWTFDTHEEADEHGKDWADESNQRDFGETDPEGGYSYEVIEVEVDDDLSPEEMDAHEGNEHMRMQRYARP